MIKHDPMYDTDKVCELYSKKDGVPIKYVCTTTTIEQGTNSVDVFYRDTPHPEFGNRYFGLYKAAGGHLMITNADAVESFEYGLVEDDDGDLQYSQHRWDYRRFDNGNMIDGGRAYVRSNGCKIHAHVVRNGEMIYYHG
jgi:cytochrome oxidase Cu insertion factor (SCO1/SenC/PrrC family)|tara:strand:+ start:5816 stop:6232 length:417 start_codon:yes stop_codon:yes gene_type:complete